MAENRTAPTAGRAQLQRVPPNDPDTESHLLGAAMLTPAAAALITPDTFYRPAHTHTAAAITQLHQAGDPCDVGTVIATLRQQGLLDAAGGPATILAHTTSTPSTSPDSAVKWAQILHSLHHRRHILGIAHNLSEAVYTNIPVGGLVAELHAADQAQAASRQTSWEPVNLAAVLAGDTPETVPAWLTRTDGQPLLYPGRVHAFNGEPEAGKGWLALAACAEAVRAGRHALYIDFEDNPAGITERLLALGLTPNQILERFTYIRPTDPLDHPNRLAVHHLADTLQPAVAVVDGVLEALAQNGWDENSNTDVAAFYEALARPLAATGAAVIVIDHVTKDKEQQGRYARGAGAKLAGIDGAVYKIENVQPFTRGQTGTSRVVLTKDRVGWIPGSGGRRTVAEISLASADRGYQVHITINPPATTTTGEPFRPTGYMERVSRALEGLPDGQDALSVTQLRRVVSGHARHTDAAIAALLKEGYLAAEPGPRRSTLHKLVTPFREDRETPPDPTQTRYEHDEEPF